MIITLTNSHCDILSNASGPRDPFALPRETPPEVRARLNEKYRLDQPYKQYLIYMKNLLHGDFSISMNTRVNQY